jgi:hypothetical protein
MRVCAATNQLGRNSACELGGVTYEKHIVLESVSGFGDLRGA